MMLNKDGSKIRISIHMPPHFKKELRLFLEKNNLPLSWAIVVKNGLKHFKKNDPFLFSFFKDSVKSSSKVTAFLDPEDLKKLKDISLYYTEQMGQWVSVSKVINASARLFINNFDAGLYKNHLSYTSKKCTLKEAIKNNDIKKVKELINNNYPLNKKRPKPLNIAWKYNHLEIVKLLIENGATK